MEDYTELMTQRFAKMLLKGYTGECTIDGKTVLMSSYNLSVSTNVVKSQAAMPFFAKRLSGYALRDCPVYTVSIQIQPNAFMFMYILSKLFKNSFGFPVVLRFTDNSSGLVYHFDPAYLNGVDVSVQFNDACVMSLTFSYFNTTFHIENSLYNVYANSVIYNEDGEAVPKEGIVGNVLMPYHAFMVKYDDYPLANVLGFSFSFQQEITPKFFCSGETSNVVNAPGPSALVWGLPLLTYNLEYVMGCGRTYVNDYERAGSHLIVSGPGFNVNEEQYAGYAGENDELPKGVDLSIYYNRELELVFRNCYPDTYSPDVGKLEDVNKYTISGSVYGRAEYGLGIDPSMLIDLYDGVDGTPYDDIRYPGDDDYNDVTTA